MPPKKSIVATLSADADVAYITPSVLRAALIASGSSDETIADKAKVTAAQVAEWAAGESYPPFKKAQALAKALRVPFGFLFLKKPPKLDLPIPDLRANPKGYRPTPEFIELLNDVAVKQEWYREFVTETKARPQLRFVGAFSLANRVSDVAANIRSTLGIDRVLRSSVGSWTEYLNTLVRRAEEAGVLVMRSSVVGHSTRKKIALQELQGFAIADDRAPLVFVNSADYKAAQIFTLAHELAHIWIGQSAIGESDQTQEPKHRIERFCNDVAADVLIPENEFLTAWDTTRADMRLYTLPRQFWVSSLVILRRAHDARRISDETFQLLREEESEKVAKKPAASGGDFYRSLVVRMGPKFTATVISEVNREKIALTQAAKLLGVSGRTLVKFAEMSR